MPYQYISTMKPLLVIAFLYLFYGSTAQTTTGTYKMLTGTIDKYPIVMHLHQRGHIYEGYYYYTSQQMPVFFNGEDSTLKGKVQLIAVTGEDKVERFTLTLTGATASGTWKQDGKAGALRLSLNRDETPFTFSYINIRGEMKLRKAVKNSPDASFNASSVWPTGSTPTDVFIQSQIRKLLEDKQPDKDITKLLQNEMNAFFSGYQDDNKEVTNDDLKDAGPSYNYEEESNLLIAYQSSKILSLNLSGSSFTGGAHGNSFTITTSLNLATNKPILLKDILTTEGVKKLRALLESSFRKQYDLKPSDSLTEGGLFENKIEPNKNFYVTGKGLLFVYNPYEIGPYVMGGIDLYLSFASLQPYLQPEFTKLLE